MGVNIFGGFTVFAFFPRLVDFNLAESQPSGCFDVRAVAYPGGVLQVLEHPPQNSARRCTPLTYMTLSYTSTLKPRLACRAVGRTLRR